MKEQKDTRFQNDSKMFIMEEKDKLCESDKVGYYPHCILGFIVRKSQKRASYTSNHSVIRSTITIFPNNVHHLFAHRIYTYNPASITDKAKNISATENPRL